MELEKLLSQICRVKKLSEEREVTDHERVAELVKLAELDKVAKLEKVAELENITGYEFHDKQHGLEALRATWEPTFERAMGGDAILRLVIIEDMLAAGSYNKGTFRYIYVCFCH